MLTTFGRKPADNDDNSAAASETVSETAEETTAAETEAPVNIDNEWAYFVVNSDNPLPVWRDTLSLSATSSCVSFDVFLNRFRFVVFI